MAALIFIPAKVGIAAAIATLVPASYFLALFIKQNIFKKPGGLFTAKF